MKIKRVIARLHLWLGLLTGIVMFIVCITGSIYVFEKEIRDITEPYRRVTALEVSYVKPSELIDIATKAIGGKPVVMVEYPSPDKAAIAAYWDKNEYKLVYMNPYSGEILKVKNMKRDFLRKVIEGHVGLWIPVIGRRIVTWSTLTFMFLLISGVILWWPKNAKRKTLKRSLGIKFSGSKKRFIHDIHTALGVYSFLFLLVISVTGLIWGFEWFSNGVYKITSGGKKPLPAWDKSFSDTTIISESKILKIPVDEIWNRYSNEYIKKGFSISVSNPVSKSDAIILNVRPEKNTIYKNKTIYFDQYSLKTIENQSLQALEFENSDTAQKIRKLNYDIHTGSILGIGGKILAFLASLIGASLPVTGFMIWIGKKK